MYKTFYQNYLKHMLDLNHWRSAVHAACRSLVFMQKSVKQICLNKHFALYLLQIEQKSTSNVTCLHPTLLIIGLFMII